MLGTYLAGLAFVEVCGEDPAYKVESEKTGRNYLNANQALLVKLRKKVHDSIVAKRGKKDAVEFSEEMKGIIPEMTAEVKIEVKKQVVSSKSCASILSNLRSGLMDIKTQRGDEIAIIVAP